MQPTYTSSHTCSHFILVRYYLPSKQSTIQVYSPSETFTCNIPRPSKFYMFKFSPIFSKGFSIILSTVILPSLELQFEHLIAQTTQHFKIFSSFAIHSYYIHHGELIHIHNTSQFFLHNHFPSFPSPPGITQHFFLSQYISNEEKNLCFLLVYTPSLSQDPKLPSSQYSDSNIAAHSQQLPAPWLTLYFSVHLLESIVGEKKREEKKTLKQILPKPQEQNNNELTEVADISNPLLCSLPLYARQTGNFSFPQELLNES